MTQNSIPSGRINPGGTEVKSEPLIGGFFVFFIIVALFIVSNRKEPEPEPLTELQQLQTEVVSLRDDLNQLILALPEDPTIVVDGQVVDEHFDWNEFHVVPTKK